VEITSLITKLLGPPERIDACEYLSAGYDRWKIFGGERFKVYLHHSFGGDWTSEFRGYPKRLISMGFVRSQEEDFGTAQALSVRAVWMVLISIASRPKPRRTPLMH